MLQLSAKKKRAYTKPHEFGLADDIPLHGAAADDKAAQ